MNAKSTKTAGTKTATKGTLAKTQAKAAKRTAKIAAKHEAIRQAAAQTPTQTPAANAIFKAAGMGQMTAALNAATAEQLEGALKLDCWPSRPRGHQQGPHPSRSSPTSVHCCRLTDVGCCSTGATRGRSGSSRTSTRTMCSSRGASSTLMAT